MSQQRTWPKPSLHKNASECHTCCPIFPLSRKKVFNLSRLSEWSIRSPFRSRQPKRAQLSAFLLSCSPQSVLMRPLTRARSLSSLHSRAFLRASVPSWTSLSMAATCASCQASTRTQPTHRLGSLQRHTPLPWQCKRWLHPTPKWANWLPPTLSKPCLFPLPSSTQWKPPSVSSSNSKQATFSSTNKLEPSHRLLTETSCSKTLLRCTSTTTSSSSARVRITSICQTRQQFTLARTLLASEVTELWITRWLGKVMKVRRTLDLFSDLLIDIRMPLLRLWHQFKTQVMTCQWQETLITLQTGLLPELPLRICWFLLMSQFCHLKSQNLDQKERLRVLIFRALSPH